MKKSSLALGLMLFGALILGVVACGDQATGGVGENETAAPVATTTAPTVGPVITVAATTTTTAVAPENAAEAEEYAVYSALIQSMYVDTERGRPYATPRPGAPPELIVLMDQTRVDAPPESGLRETLNSRFSDWPRLEDDILADFETENEHPRALKPLFSLSVESVLLSVPELEALWADKAPGLDAFREEYPTSQGLLTLSRVGFNQGMDAALVFAANDLGGTGGEGYYWLLGKVAGRWTVQKGFMIWTS
jgi:hypothetical protein